MFENDGLAKEPIKLSPFKLLSVLLIITNNNCLNFLLN